MTGLTIQRLPLLNNKLLVAIAFVFALVAQPLYSAAISYVAYAEPVGNTWNDIDNITDLKAAFANPAYTYIGLKRDVVLTTSEPLLIARDGVRFNGNDSTLQFTGDTNGWQGHYVLKVWKANDVKLNSVRTSGGDAGVLVSSSEVTFTGNTHNNNHEFGGIEVSRSAQTGSVNSIATLEGGLWNAASSEATGKPAVWVVNGEGTLTYSSLYQPLYIATHIKPDQTQYYLTQANTGTVVTNITKGETFTTIQGAVDAAAAGDTLRLDADVTVTSAVQLNKQLTIDGNSHTVTASYTESSNTNNASFLLHNGATGTTIKNITVTRVASANTIHGINVQSGATNVTLQDITAIGNSAGVNVGNGAVVSIHNIHTAGSIWYGIGVDTGGTVKVSGTNSHDEAAHIVNDNITNSTVIDSDNAYHVKSQVGTVRAYVLGSLQAPVLTTASPYIANGSSKTLSWQTVEDAAGYEYAEYNNTAPTSDTTTPSWTKTVTGTSTTDTAWQSDIKIYWRVRAIDAAGNKGPWSETRLIVSDRTKPVVTGSSEPAYNPTSFTITATDNFNVAKVVGNIYKLDTTTDTYVLYQSNSSTTQNPYTVDLSTLPDGKYYVKYNATDEAGNIASTKQYPFTVDHTVPTGTFTYSNNNGNTVTASDVEVKLTTNEPIDTPAGWIRVSDTVFTRTYGTNGKYTVAVSDVAGNSSTLNYEVKRIDKVAPVFSGITEGGVYKSAVTLTITDQNFSMLTVNGTPVATTSVGGWSYAPVAALTSSGSYELIATDKAGNNKTIAFTIDTTIIVTINDIDTTTATPTISGTALWNADSAKAQNQTVTVLIKDTDGTVVQTLEATTDSDGVWSVTVPTALSNGLYTIVSSIGVAGTATRSYAVNISAVDQSDNDASGSEVTTSASPRTTTVSIPASTLLAQAGTVGVSLQAAGTPAAGTTTNTEATTESSSDILGAETEAGSKVADATSAVSSAAQGLNYWWLLAVAVVAGVAWWFIAALRRRKRAEQA